MPKAEIINVRNENENSLHWIPRLSTALPRNVLKTGTLYLSTWLNPSLNDLYVWTLTGFELQFDLLSFVIRSSSSSTCSSFEWFCSGFRLDRTNRKRSSLKSAVICTLVHWELFTIVVAIVPRNLLTFWVTPARLHVFKYVYVCVSLNSIALIEQLECRFLSILYLTRCASDRCSRYLFVVNWYSSSKAKWFARQSARHTHRAHTHRATTKMKLEIHLYLSA